MRDHAIYAHLGDVIKRRRKHFKLTQKKLAARLAMSRASVANIETGRQTVLVHQLYGFATALNLSLADLLPPPPTFESGDRQEQLPLPAGLKPQQQEQISRLIADASPESPEDEDSSNANRTRHRPRSSGPGRS